MHILEIIELLQIVEALQGPPDSLDPRELPMEKQGLLGSLGMPVRHRGPQRSSGRQGMSQILGIPGGGGGSMGGSF